MPIITLPGHGLSNSAAGRSKKWIKILTTVDTSKSDGYAFVGPFTTYSATIEVDNGTWILGYIEDVRSSGRFAGRDVALYQVRDDVLVEVKSWYLDARGGWALKIRDEITALMAAPTPAPSIEQLLTERAQLLARLAEIDALLPGTPGPAIKVREIETVWCEAHDGLNNPHFVRDDCVDPHYTDQQTRARMNAAFRTA